jgi:hypothetical protein
MHQVTIYATLTGATPGTIKQLLDDPRIDSDQQLSDLPVQGPVPTWDDAL